MAFSASVEDAASTILLEDTIMRCLVNAVGLGFGRRSIGNVVLSLVRLACEEEGLKDRLGILKVIVDDVDEEGTVDEVGYELA